jgi:hypothetical protein
MRRLAMVPVFLAVVAAAAFTGAAPAAPGEGGPACTDITGQTHNFPSSTTGTYTLRMQVALAAPACIGKINYRLFAVTDTGTVEATLTGYSAEGYPQFELSTTDSTICVFGTTSAAKTGHLYDRAPNATATPDCLELTAGAPGGEVGFS